MARFRAEMGWEDSPYWFGGRRRRWPFFGSSFFRDFDEIIRDMEEFIEREFREIESRVPRTLVRERKSPDGRVTKEWGPFVYGYSVTVGPDGKPHVREFGNFKPTTKPGTLGERPTVEILESREPLVDIVEGETEVKVVAEVPGVDKDDIKVHGSEENMTISVDTPQRKYFKEIIFPARVDPNQVKSTFKNGILDVTFAKLPQERKIRGKPVKIE